METDHHSSLLLLLQQPPPAAAPTFPCLLFCANDEALRKAAAPLFEKLCQVPLGLVEWSRQPPLQVRQGGGEGGGSVAAPAAAPSNGDNNNSAASSSSKQHHHRRDHELDGRLRLGALDLRAWRHDVWPLQWCDGKRWELQVCWETTEDNLIDRISDLVQEPVRAEARSVNAKLSIAEYWRRHHDLVEADAVEWNEGEVSPTTLRRSLFHLAEGTCCNFRTSVARRILLLASEYLGGGEQEGGGSKRGLRILDPCAGWGDRMVAAMSLMGRDNNNNNNGGGIVASYTGVDPNGALHPGYARLRQVLLPDGGDVCMVESPFEKLDHAGLHEALHSRGPFDVVWTSPPYFDRELYCPAGGAGANHQSFQPGMSVEEWLHSFLFPMLSRAIHHLRPGGLLILSINDAWRHITGDKTPATVAAAAPVERIQYTRAMSDYLYGSEKMRYVGMVPFQVVRQQSVAAATSSSSDKEPAAAEIVNAQQQQVKHEDTVVEKRNSTQPLWVWQKPTEIQARRRKINEEEEEEERQRRLRRRPQHPPPMQQQHQQHSSRYSSSSHHRTTFRQQQQQQHTVAETQDEEEERLRRLRRRPLLPSQEQHDHHNYYSGGCSRPSYSSSAAAAAGYNHNNNNSRHHHNGGNRHHYNHHYYQQQQRAPPSVASGRRKWRSGGDDVHANNTREQQQRRSRQRRH